MLPHQTHTNESPTLLPNQFRVCVMTSETLVIILQTIMYLETPIGIEDGDEDQVMASLVPVETKLRGHVECLLPGLAESLVDRSVLRPHQKRRYRKRVDKKILKHPKNLRHAQRE